MGFGQDACLVAGRLFLCARLGLLYPCSFIAAPLGMAREISLLYENKKKINMFAS